MNSNPCKNRWGEKTNAKRKDKKCAMQANTSTPDLG
jgi:hypothetical protein